MNVWGTTSQRLSNPVIRRPPEEWIRCNTAFTPIVDPATFEKVRARFASGCLYTEEHLLNALRQLLAKRGRLTEAIITHSRGYPSSHAYQLHFGSLNKAYQMIGYTPTFCSLNTPERRAKSIELRNKCMRKIACTCPTVVQLLARNCKLRPHLLVDESIRVPVLILPTTTTLDGHLRWLCYPVSRETKYVTLACALDATNTHIRSSYVWAPGATRKTFRTQKAMAEWGFRFSSPLAFPRLVRHAAQLRIRSSNVSGRNDAR
jgi:hypothetical protein